MATGTPVPRCARPPRDVAAGTFVVLEEAMGVSWSPSSQRSAPDDFLTRVPRPQPAKVAIAPEEFAEVARRVRAEYMEMPGLSLTRDQAQCLWGIDGALCDRLLAHLVESGFLARTSHATYVRVGA